MYPYMKNMHKEYIHNNVHIHIKHMYVNICAIIYISTYIYLYTLTYIFAYHSTS